MRLWDLRGGLPLGASRKLKGTVRALAIDDRLLVRRDWIVYQINQGRLTLMCLILSSLNLTTLPGSGVPALGVNLLSIPLILLNIWFADGSWHQTRKKDETDL